MNIPSSQTKLQFSLKTAFSWLTIAALALCIAMASYGQISLRLQHQTEINKLTAKHQSDLQAQERSWSQRERDAERESQQVQSELQYMRFLAGYPDISNPNVVSVGVQKGTSSGRWEFRIHCPVGRELVLCYAIEGIPDEGLPKPTKRLPLLSSTNRIRELLIIVNVVTSEAFKIKTCHLKIEGSLAEPESVFLPSHHPLHLSDFDFDGIVNSMLAQRGSTLTVDCPQVILRHRKSGATPSQGLILWLDDAGELSSGATLSP